MALYLRVGKIKENVTGRGSRGYSILRNGRNVYRMWGGVEIINRETVWRKGWPQFKKDRFRNEQIAKRFMKFIIKKKMSYKDTPYMKMRRRKNELET